MAESGVERGVCDTLDDCIQVCVACCVACRLYSWACGPVAYAEASQSYFLVHHWSDFIDYPTHQHSGAWPACWPVYTCRCSWRHALYLRLYCLRQPAQSGSAGEQADAIFSQLKIIAASQNISLKNLVKVTVFVSDFTQIPELREALTRHYQEDVPASSMVIVDGLFSPDLLVEIEAIFSLNAHL